MLFSSLALTAEMERSNGLVGRPDKISQFRLDICAARRQRDDFNSKLNDAKRQGAQDVGEVSSISHVRLGQDRFFFQEYTKQFLSYVDKL